MAQQQPYTREEVAEIFGVTVRTIFNWVRRGRIPHRPLRSSTVRPWSVFDRAAIRNHIAQRAGVSPRTAARWIAEGRVKDELRRRKCQRA